ncbi:MAG: hypothetical protein U9R20_03685 [Thermodesulfobacteriota bacterium]|nr:hypothetical protein [Thermodesulfobacteriota bacterium]
MINRWKRSGQKRKRGFFERLYTCFTSELIKIEEARDNVTVMVVGMENEKKG